MSVISRFESILYKNKIRKNIVEHGSLTKDCPKYEHAISGLKIPLKEHQKTLVYSLLELESSSIGLRNQGEIQYQSNLGIIGDQVGSGKSVSALALISIRPKLEFYTFPNQFIHHNGLGLIVFEPNNKQVKIETNLIVVPHSILVQWDKYIKEYTSLKHYKVNNTKSSVFSQETLETNHVILVSNNFLVPFYNQIKALYNTEKVVFERVFIDEADNIKITHGLEPRGLFHWFITSSIENLFFVEGSYQLLQDETQNVSFSNVKVEYVRGLRYKNYIQSLFLNLNNLNFRAIDVFHKICLKNNSQYVQESFGLANPNYSVYHARTPSSLNLLNSGVLSSESGLGKELANYINANNIQALKERLGFNVETNDSIANMLTARLQKNLFNEQKHIEYLQTIQIDEQDRIERLQKAQKRADEIQKSIDHIVQRIQLDNTCPICHDNLNEPICSVICCGNLFCMDCLTSYFTHAKREDCPCCRTKIGFKGITIVSDKSLDAPLEKKGKSKDELFRELIQENTNKKWLVFSSFDNTFESLKKSLDQLNITYSQICGTSSHIQRVIEDFKDGKIRVLMLNAIHFGMGLNLEMATDLLIYHELQTNIEHQVIGRAQRPGRVSPLNVHLFCHQNELQGYQTRFPQAVYHNFADT